MIKLIEEYGDKRRDVAEDEFLISEGYKSIAEG